MIITCSSQKGGIGKTTVSAAAAALLAQRFRVVLVDLDPEAFATSMGLGQQKAADPLHDAPVRVEHPALTQGSLWLLAGGDAIHGASEGAIGAHIARAQRLAEIVVVDTPPSGRSAATHAALRAASLVVAPVTPDFAALAGLESLLATARVLGVRAPVRTLLSRWEPRTVLAQDVHQQLVSAHPDLLLPIAIPKDQKAAESMAAGCPVPLYARRSAAATAFRTATYAIAALMQLNIPKGAI